MSARLEEITEWEVLARKSGYRVEVLASALGVSRQTLRHHTLQRLGVPTKVWLADLKMREARQLLKGCTRIKEIAQQVGFQHPTHFSRAFRSAHGTNPKAFLVLQINQFSRTCSKMV